MRQLQKRVREDRSNRERRLSGATIWYDQLVITQYDVGGLFKYIIKPAVILEKGSLTEIICVWSSGRSDGAGDLKLRRREPPTPDPVLDSTFESIARTSIGLEAVRMLCLFSFAGVAMQPLSWYIRKS